MTDEPRLGEGYALGIDLGTTYSAAAILRGKRVEPVGLGTVAAQIPSVVVHRENDEVLTGEAAERRAVSEPTRAAREFKRRLGDPVPIIVGGVPYGAEALMAELLRAIVQQVTDREGEPPDTIVLTHPANYSEYKCELLREAARLAGLSLERVQLITEPAAAALAYAHQQRIDPQEVIAVYDLGGGTFDAAVVRSGPNGFELLGTPEGMERLGGIDFDQAILFHVDAALGGLVADADSSDAQVSAGQARLRDECRRAKEALSNDTDAAIAVSLPGVHTEVRLTREELEQMVRPRIAETVRALERTIESAGITASSVSRVLLVGGSSRMPIVGQVVRDTIGRPVSVDTDPKLAIAIGAALSALAPAPPAPSPISPPRVEALLPVRVTASPGHRRSRRQFVAVSVACAVVAGVSIAVLRSGDEPTAQPLMSSTLGSATTVSVAVVSQPGVSGPVLPVVPAGSDGVAARLAFDGSTEGAGIPGPALSAGVPGQLLGVATALNGDLYITSVGVAVLSVIDGQVRPVAGFEAQDTGSSGIAVAADGSVFVSTAEGVVSVRRGVRELVIDGAAAGLSGTLGALALDGGGNLYVVDNGTGRVVRRAPDGSLTLVAGTGSLAVAGATPAEGAVAASTEIGVINGMVIDRDGNLLMTDATLGRVRAVDRSGLISTVKLLAQPTGVAVDQRGTVFVGDGAAGVILQVAAGEKGEPVTGSAGTRTVALAMSSAGALIFTDGFVLLALSSVG